MSHKKIEEREYGFPPRAATGDRGAIWKCFDFQRCPIGYLVTTGKNLTSPVAYVGLLPGYLLKSAPAGATLRPVGFDGPELYRQAQAIAVDFAKASDQPTTDLRHVSLKDADTVPPFLFYLVLKPTTVDDRAVRSEYHGARYRPLALPGDSTPGVSLFLAADEEGLTPNPLLEGELPPLDQSGRRDDLHESESLELATA